MASVDDWLPLLTHLLQATSIVGCPSRPDIVTHGRVAVPAFEPDPIRTSHVQKRTEDRFVTDVDIAQQFFGRQLLRSTQHTRVRPFGVREQVTNFSNGHAAHDASRHRTSQLLAPGRCWPSALRPYRRHPNRAWNRFSRRRLTSSDAADPARTLTPICAGRR